MLRSTTKAILFLVEGPGDLALLWAVFGLLKENIVVCHGKENLDEAVRFLSGTVDGFLAIRDRDFDGVSGSDKVVVTSAYDLEMELLKTGSLEAILEGFGSQDKVRKTSNSIANAAKEIVSQAAKIGALRLYCQTNGLPANFDDLSSSIVSANAIAIDVARLFEAVSNKSGGQVKLHFAGNSKDMLKEHAAIMSQRGDQWLCVGHDALWLMSITLRKVLATLKADDCRADALRRCLYAASQPSQLVRSTFYRQFCEAVGRLSDRFSYQGRVLDEPEVASAA